MVKSFIESGFTSRVDYDAWLASSGEGREGTDDGTAAVTAGIKKVVVSKVNHILSLMPCEYDAIRILCAHGVANGCDGGAMLLLLLHGFRHTRSSTPR